MASCISACAKSLAASQDAAAAQQAARAAIEMPTDLRGHQYVVPDLSHSTWGAGSPDSGGCQLGLCWQWYMQHNKTCQGQPWRSSPETFQAAHTTMSAIEGFHTNKAHTSRTLRDPLKLACQAAMLTVTVSAIFDPHCSA